MLIVELELRNRITKSKTQKRCAKSIFECCKIDGMRIRGIRENTNTQTDVTNMKLLSWVMIKFFPFHQRDVTLTTRTYSHNLLQQISTNDVCISTFRMTMTKFLWFQIVVRLIITIQD